VSCVSGVVRRGLGRWARRVHAHPVTSIVHVDVDGVTLLSLVYPIAAKGTKSRNCEFLLESRINIACSIVLSTFPVCVAYVFFGYVQIWS
jgi:hypothetical protein